MSFSRLFSFVYLLQKKLAATHQRGRVVIFRVLTIAFRWAPTRRQALKYADAFADDEHRMSEFGCVCT